MKKVLVVLLMLAVVMAAFAGGGKDSGAAKGSGVVSVYNEDLVISSLNNFGFPLAKHAISPMTAVGRF